MSGALLSVENLTVTMGGRPVVEEVSFALRPGESLGLVGESGCGKTVTALALLRLVPEPPGRIAGGHIVLEGQDLLALDPRALRRLRGDRIAMIFQEPMTALNPVFTVGDQIAEVLRVHTNASRKDAWAKAVEMLELMGIPAPAERAKQYPHQLSGGMRQRVMIAMALVMNPALVIADEPTPGLPAEAVRAALADLRRIADQDRAVVLITHDLAAALEVADRVVICRDGRTVDTTDPAAFTGDGDALAHPFTRALWQALPGNGFRVAEGV